MMKIGCVALVVALASAVSGCATYHAAPLSGATDELVALASSNRQLLSEIEAAVSQGTPLSTDALAEAALRASPDIAVMRAQVQLTEAQAKASGLLPDPHLDLAAERPRGAGLVNGLSAALSLDIAAMVSMPTRREGARAELQRAEQELRWNEWLARQRIKTLVTQVSALRRQWVLANDAESSSAQRLQSAQRAADQGDSTIDQASVFRVGYLDAANRRFDIERARNAAESELVAAVGLPPETHLLLQDEPDFELCAVDSAAITQVAIERRADLNALRAAYAAKESGVKLAVQSSWNLPQLSLTRVRDTAGIWSWGLGVGGALPLWNRGRGEIAIAEADRAQLAAEYRSRIYQVVHDIASLGTDVDVLCRQFQTLHDEVPPLARAVSAMEDALKRGDLDVVTWETLRMSLLDKQLAMEGAQRALSETRIALETAKGEAWNTP